MGSSSSGGGPAAGSALRGLLGNSPADFRSPLFRPENLYNHHHASEPKGCDMNDNDEFAAAMLASALVEIQRGAVELEPDPIEAAAMMYFDCLDAIRSERIKRVARTKR